MIGGKSDVGRGIKNKNPWGLQVSEVRKACFVRKSDIEVFTAERNLPIRQGFYKQMRPQLTKSQLRR